ncbi:hypothetical protein VIGAN_05248600 [Vigna angularis var. angularis]|uniref:Protein kinase domain-containing protein n=1 Tax=Vigna angularis var. angularis TaxID=157739 RepID=A0A0S3S7N0_PHAAN|nr:hypothetical protein VIGAN_05248600 [Vigna angularis var. angularis]
MIVFLASTLPPPKSATAPKPMAPELSTTIASSGDILGATELRGPVNYKYNDLKAGTKNFSAENKLGEGGFGAVYKVVLACERREGFQETRVLPRLWKRSS